MVSKVGIIGPHIQKEKPERQVWWELRRLEFGEKRGRRRRKKVSANGSLLFSTMAPLVKPQKYFAPHFDGVFGH